MSAATRWASGFGPRVYADPGNLHMPVARSPWLAALILFSLNVAAQESHLSLNDGWSFCQVGKERWYPAEVPGVVQTDLLRNGLIPDFYKGSNIDSVQWIENEDWIYKRTLVAHDTLLKHGHLDLVFKGLDTFAEVYLNDSLLGKADNMFHAWEWPIKELLRSGANELKVIFRSPIKEGAKLRDAYGIQLPHDNDPSGVSPYIRKAAYQFGWDFCPRLVTSGIWQGVELRGWSGARIIQFDVIVVPKGDSLSLVLGARLPRPLTMVAQVRFSIDGRILAQKPVVDVEEYNMAGYKRTVPLPDRWWPAGEGLRNMHVFSAELLDARGKVMDRLERKTGFRTIELVKDTDTIGSAFTFRVNGRDMLMKGCNLVPPSMVPIGDAPWLNLVHEIRRAGMNMVRVWAGGVYPPDVFFEACDTAGILVWQDFMLGALPPGNREFRHSLSWEVGEQIFRLRDHPCMALFCGDNELDVAWKNWGWQERYRLLGNDSVRVIDDYRAVQQTIAMWPRGGHVPFTPTSPLSNWGNAEGLKSGDLHYWGVWHGDSAFSSFKNNVGRFVSEYGFQSYPDSALLSHYIDPKELYLGSPAMKRMQRSYKTDKPIWDAIKRELGREPKTLGEFIEDSQEVQAKAYRMAIEAHMAAQPHCMGTLFWQLNDCWPGPSWSLIDYEGNWKPGMYEVQKLYNGEK